MTVNLSIEVQSYNDDLQSSTVDSVVSIIDSYLVDTDLGGARVSSLPTKRKVWTVNRRSLTSGLRSRYIQAIQFE